MSCRYLSTALIVGLGLPLAAQEVPHPGKTRDYETIQVPSYYRNFNSFNSRNEWGWSERSLLTVGNSYTLLQPSAVFDNFTLDYRQPEWEATLGTQFLRGSLPIYDQFVMRGVRAGWQGGPWSGALWGGTTQDILGELSGLRNRQALAGATFAYTPDDFRSLGLAVMPYASVPGGPIDRTLTMGQLYWGGESEQGQSYGLLAGYGRDLQASGAAGQGLSVVGNYSDDRLRVNLRTFVLGRDFGPPQGLFDLRGRHFSTLTGEYRLSDELTFTEDASIYEFDLGSNHASRTATLNHGLRYQGDGYNLSGSWQQLSQLGPGQASYGNTYMVSGNFRAGQWELQPILRQSDLGTVKSQEAGLSVRLPLTSRARLAVQEFYDRNSQNGSGFQTNLALTYSIPDRGELSFGYSRQDSLAGTFYQGLKRDSFFAAGSLKLRGDLLLNASISQTFGQAALLWYPDDHNRVALEHRFQDPRNQFLYADFTSYPLGHYTNLTWTSSHGGPLQKEFERLRRGSIRLAFHSHAPQDADLVPVSDIRVVIDGQELRTDENGEALAAGLSPGPHRVEVPAASLPTVYQLESVPTPAVELGAGDSLRLEATATAYAGVEVVVFNDVQQNGRLEALDYLPISGIGVRGPQGVVRETDAAGRIEYNELMPGAYTFALDSLPAGYEISRLEESLELRSGERRRVVFGLRGKGRLRVQTSRLEPGSLDRIVPVADLPFVLDGKTPVHSGSQAVLEYELYSGSHRLGLSPSRVNQSYLLEPAGEVSVPINGVAETRLLMADFAELRVKVAGGVSADGVALTLVGPGAAARTVYLDETGAFVFDHLKVGEYRLRLEELTLPEGFVLDGPAEAVLPLGSGLRKELLLRLRKKK